MLSAKPRIAMVSMHTCPLVTMGGKKAGGMSVYVRELAKVLGELGFEIDVFTRLKSRCQPQISHDLGSGNRVIHIEAGPESLETTTEIADYVDDFGKGIVTFIESDKGNKGYDLIHSHYWLSGLVAELLNKLLPSSIPVVQMFHTLGHLKNNIAADESQQADLRRLEGESHVIKHVASVIVAATESEEKHLIDLYGADKNKISIVPPGVDIERFSPRDRKEAKTRIGVDCGQELVMFAGRIEPLKGIDTLLRAMGILDGRGPASSDGRCVVIVGGNPWDEDLEPEMFRLKAITNELGISNHVAFVGAKDQLLLPDYYAASDVIVMPSHYESFGMVALEAMAMERPVIASEVGGLAHLVRHGFNGLHVGSKDPEELANAIHKLLSDDAYRKKLGSQARDYALDFSWNKIAKQISDLYSESLAIK